MKRSSLAIELREQTNNKFIGVWYDYPNGFDINEIYRERCDYFCYIFLAKSLFLIRRLYCYNLTVILYRRKTSLRRNLPRW